MSHEPLREPPRLLDASSTDPLLRDALRVVRADTPPLASLDALADKVQHAVHDPGAATTVASAASSSALKLVLAAVLVGAGMYGAYRLATPTAQQAAAPRIEDPRVAPPIAIDRQRTATSARPSDVQPAAQMSAAQPAGPGRARTPAEPVLAPSPTHPARVAPRVHATPPRPYARAERARPKIAPAEASAEASAEAAAEPSQEQQRSESKRGEDEVTLLENAQRELQDDPQAALERLNEHRERFPTGAFAQEREALYIDALQRVGRTSESASRARAFLERWPKSPHRARIQRLLGGQ